MDVTVVGLVVSAAGAFAAAVFTASQGRQSADAATEVTDRESERVYQLEFTKTLSSEVQVLNERVAMLRARLTAAENAADEELRKRRILESDLHQMREALTALQQYLISLPPDSTPPSVRRYLDTLDSSRGGTP